MKDSKQVRLYVPTAVTSRQGEPIGDASDIVFAISAWYWLTPRYDHRPCHPAEL